MSSKSVLGDVLKHVFGDYSRDVKIDTGTKVRLAVLEEDEGEKIHVGKIREMTGNDSFIFPYYKK